MIDLETSCHEKKNAKRATKIGVMNQKIWPFEVPSILCNLWTITP
jgi:hypothetical protein